MARHFGITYGAALVSSVVTFIVSYFAFRWPLIRYHEWRIGHKNPFTIWADMRAAPLALLAAVLVFLFVVKRANRNPPK